eukprot:3940286-Rhodomonas_salina.2
MGNLNAVLYTPLRLARMGQLLRDMGWGGQIAFVGSWYTFSKAAKFLGLSANLWHVHVTTLLNNTGGCPSPTTAGTGFEYRLPCPRPAGIKQHGSNFS